MLRKILTFQNIKKQAFSKNKRALPDDIADDINNLLFRLLGLTINDIPPKILDELFNLINQLSTSDIRRLMRNDVTDKEVIELSKLILRSINISELIKVLKKDHVKYIMEALFELEAGIITEEIHNLIFWHHKIKIKDMYC